MEKIICIVVTYNRKELLQECLDALLSQSRLPDKILVFNNCSTDGTEELFASGAKYDTDRIELTESSANLGGAGGFSAGMKLACDQDFDWIWIMDDDSIPEPEALSQLENAASFLKERNEKIGFLASFVYGPQGEPMNVPRIQDASAPNGYPFWYRYLGQGLVSIKEATFVSLLISKHAVEAVGYPIAEYFIWGDDAEYTRRIVEEYAPAYFCGASRVLHKRQNAARITIKEEHEKSRAAMYRYYYRNALLNAAKYDGKAKTIVRWFYYFSLSLQCLLNPKGSFRVQKFAAVQRGIWSFLFGPLRRKINE